MGAGRRDTEVAVRSDDELGVLGRSFAAMATTLDATTAELRSAAEEEAAARNRLQAVISGMSEVLVAVDDDGAVIEVNAAAEELLDVDRSSAVGRPVAELVRWRLADGGEDALAADDLPEGVPMAADVAVGDGAVPVVVTSAALLDHYGFAAGRCWCSATCVPARGRGPEGVDPGQPQPRAADPAHADQGLRRRARRSEVDPERRRMMADRIVEGVDRVERVVHQLVTFATLDAGTVPVEPVAVALGDLAAGIEERWRARVPDGHSLAVTAGDRATEAHVDPDLLARAVDELVDNAFRYTPDGGPVTVDVAVDDGVLALRVTDEGIGIDPADLARLTDPFVQADGSATRRTGGLGLGLASAERIARAHGGTIDVTPNGRRGTVVSILVPATTATGDDARR